MKSSLRKRIIFRMVSPSATGRRDEKTAARLAEALIPLSLRARRFATSVRIAQETDKRPRARAK